MESLKTIIERTLNEVCKDQRLAQELLMKKREGLTQQEAFRAFLDIMLIEMPDDKQNALKFELAANALYLAGYNRGRADALAPGAPGLN
jgi:hypothetical protein